MPALNTSDGLKKGITENPANISEKINAKAQRKLAVCKIDTKFLMGLNA
jgi:hypothetical protein